MTTSRNPLMTNISVCINIIAVLVLVSTSQAIVTASQSEGEVSKLTNITTSSNETQAHEGDGSKKLDSNSTFYYDSEAFMVSKRGETNQKEGLIGNQVVQNSTKNNRDVDKDKKSPLPPPAGPSMTSGRNGRMLDLDALMGDIEASRSNKDHSISGSRQSRFLPSVGNFDVSGGKRLHIQGFIPIVGIKDESGTNDADDDNSSSSRHRPMNSAGGGIYSSNGVNNNNNELPYAKSSIGHASFVNGVQRYLNTDSTMQQQQFQSAAPDNLQPPKEAQQVNAKYSGATFSVVDSIKKPLKKLTNFAVAGSSTNEISSPKDRIAGVSQQQNCLCVPFYMCKNGLISESSLGRSQIQQMIFQQQQQAFPQQNQQLYQQPRQIDQNSLDLRRGGPISTLALQSNALQQQQSINDANILAANSHPLIDERSFERDIITASPNMGQNSFANDTMDMQTDSFLAYEQMTSVTTTASPIAISITPTTTQVPANLLIDSQQQQHDIGSHSTSNVYLNSSDTQLSGQASDYSQDILGRMLSLKAASNGKLQSFMDGSGGVSASQPGPAGACGLLRTCCSIPAQLLLPSQQQAYSNERLRTLNGNQNNKFPLVQQVGANNPNYMTSQQFQQQIIPYGMPMQVARVQPAVNNYQTTTYDKNSLAQQQQTALIHRSNQYHTQNQRHQMAGMGARLQPQPLINQFQARPNAAPRMQQAPLQAAESQVLNGWLSPGEIKSLVGGTQMMPAASQSVGQQIIRENLGNGSGFNNNNDNTNNNVNNMGTRKLLEGRCGLRQSAGITGRVQTLQYHESSADFGEYPAQAAILKRLNGSESLFVCGGTLISQYWIATAAHCIKKNMNSDLKVRLGEWDVHRDDEFYPFVEKEVRDIVVHPDFLPNNLVNDLALIRLDSPIDASLPHVNPACLPTIDEQFTRQQCWVTGWGKDSFGQMGSFQSVLKEVELPIIGHNDCESALKQTRLGPHYRLHQGFICAGGEGGKDACEGDGGSGLYCVQEGVIKVAGLVSWGIGCGQPGVPGVYVNLAHYRPWIENIISIDEDVYSKNSAPIKASTS